MTLAGHNLGGLADADEGAAQVGLDDAVKIFVLHAQHQAVLGDASIVDQHAQLDLILDMLFEEGRDRFGVGNVKAKGTGLPARRSNILGHGFGFISLADIGEIHLISGLRQRLRNGLADASGAAGYECGGKLFAHFSHLDAVFSCL